ncbi:MAG: NAD(P)-binding domain-containing protein [Mycobacteriaceae bacterium]
METTQFLLHKMHIVVIGAGQAGLSAGYFLHKQGLKANDDFVILDDAPGPGGAWQFRWPSLTLKAANHIHDLPGMAFPFNNLDAHQPEVLAAEAVPRYFGEYEKKFQLNVRRKIQVSAVHTQKTDSRLLVETNTGKYLTHGIINATGTWEKPFWPSYPGAQSFLGQQLHTKYYRRATDFLGKHVLVVGGGVSAVQLLSEISEHTRTSWVTRRPPRFRTGEFSPEIGRAAVARVEERVRRGLPPESVVSVTGLSWTPQLVAAKKRGALNPLPMFTRITAQGVSWDSSEYDDLAVDVILWCTGFRSALDHLKPLHLRSPGGGITMTGRLATQVADLPQLHLLGYGPSASTIGANRAGRAAVAELLQTIGQ